ANRQDQARNARRCLRRMSVPETMPDRQHRRGTLRPGVHRQAAASGRAASGTRNRCLQGTVRDAVGDRVDQQRFEEPPGTGATARAWSGKRVSCDLAQAGWNVLRAASSKKLRAWVAEQMARLLKRGESALFGTCFGALLRLDERRDP